MGHRVRGRVQQDLLLEPQPARRHRGFGTPATGYLAMPLGRIVFGHFGDRIGRKKMLVLSKTLMGGGRTLIGVLPTYAQIGVRPRSCWSSCGLAGRRRRR